jgi:serine/threonine-protein kinase PpkA
MQIPGYRIERLIAEGGMASVYLAVQQSLGRHVALKVLRKFDNAEQAKRFMEEGRIIAAINHRSVITIHDFGVVEDRPYLAMEYLEGGSLEQRIRQGMSVEEALDLVEKIADCLDAVHSRGVVHRDVKPENILFHKDGTPILTDFGIAKQLAYDAKLTLDDTALGSPFYLSPEQAETKAVDGRTDIYGLGIIFYEMLMGRRPYGADSYIQTILAHITDPIPTLPQELRKYQSLLDSMLAKHPGDRFASAEELAERVRELRRSGLGAQAKRKISEYVEGWGPTSDGVDESQPSRTSTRSPTQCRASVLKDTDAQSLLPGVSQTPAGKAPTGWLVGAAIGVIVLLAAGVAALVLHSPADSSAALTASVANPGTGTDARAPAAQAAGAPGPGLPQLPRPELASDANVAPTQILGLPAPGSTTAATEALPGATDVAPPADAQTVQTRPESAQTSGDLAPPAELTPEARIDALLVSAREALATFRLTTPPHDSALHYYEEVLNLDPKQPEARSGMGLIAERYAVLVDDAIDKADYKKADLYLQRGLGLQPDNQRLVEAERRLVEAEQARASEEDGTEPQQKPRRGFLETLKSFLRRPAAEPTQ